MAAVAAAELQWLIRVSKPQLFNAGWDEDVEHHWDIAFELGRAHYLAGEPRAGLIWYRRSVELRPHAVTWQNIAELEADLGDPEAARRALAEAARA